jgi:predicted Zn-dependent protease
MALAKEEFENRKWPDAAANLQQVLRLQPRNDEAHLLLGLTWRAMNKPQDAEAELIEAARENPGNATNLYYAGHQLLLNDKPETALSYFYRVVTLEPDNINGLRAIANTQVRLGNYGLAENYYRRALAVKSLPAENEGLICIDLAYLLLLRHDTPSLSEAVSLGQRSVRLLPQSADAHFIFGKALLKTGRAAEVLTELKAASRLRPEDAKTHFLLAEAYERLGDNAAAARERNEFDRLRRQAAVASGMASANAPVQ